MAEKTSVPEMYGSLVFNDTNLFNKEEQPWLRKHLSLKCTAVWYLTIR